MSLSIREILKNVLAIAVLATGKTIINGHDPKDDRVSFDDREKFAAERSHHDAQALTQQALSAAQSLILVNGGAATATLAFASQYSGEIPRLQAWLFATGLFFYVIGIVIGTYNLRVLTSATYHFMMGWQERAHGNIGKWQKHLKKGGQKQKIGNLVCTIGYPMFLLGSISLGFAVLSEPEEVCQWVYKWGERLQWEKIPKVLECPATNS